MGKTAIIFPGQGAQLLGMGRDVADAFPVARRTYLEANRILGFDLAQLCFAGPVDELNTTAISQPAILVTSVAMWRALEEIGQAADFDAQAMAGLSLGEYTALHLAGSLDFEDAVRLVARRGRLMQDAADAAPGGMVSIMGLDEGKVDDICQSAAKGEVLAAANFNCPGQIVISGARGACERAAAMAEQAGGRSIPLNVAGAFHSDLMRPAAAGLAKVLADTTVQSSRIPVVSNVTADYHGTPEQISALLVEQVVRPVRWQSSIERLIADGFDRFVEVGPGRVLTGLMRKINRSVSAVNYSTAETLEKVATP